MVDCTHRCNVIERIHLCINTGWHHLSLSKFVFGLLKNPKQNSTYKQTDYLQFSLLSIFQFVFNLFNLLAMILRIWLLFAIVVVPGSTLVAADPSNLNSECWNYAGKLVWRLTSNAYLHHCITIHSATICFVIRLNIFTQMFNDCYLIFLVKFLSPGVEHQHESQQNSMYFRPDMRIYCYRGSEKTLSAIFQSALIQVHIDNDDFVQYEGHTAEIVNEQYENQRTIFSFNVLNTKKNKLIKLDPFNQTCVGIETAHNYTIVLNLIRIDFWKLILLGIGAFIFISAKKLSQTPLFYYLTGIFLGIFASVLVIVYFSSKLFPKVMSPHSLI